MGVRAQAYIRSSALKHNLARVRAYAPQSRVMAAIKADGYGHGALQIAAALEDAHALAVATLDEAMQLRWHGEQRDLIILSGLNRLEDFRTAAEHRIQVVIHDQHHLDCLTELDDGYKLSLWIKLDTGMHRLGFPAQQAHDISAYLQARENLTLTGWLTHFACADDLDSALTSEQIDCFAESLLRIEGLRSLANSAAIVSRPDSHGDWVRPGIMLYGGCPILGKSAAEFDLKPVMSLRSELIAMHELPAGAGIGYGQTWQCPEAMPVGVVGIGYGDGYPRHAPNGTPVAVNGQPVPLVGRVSMDMICVDLREQPGAKVGDPVELWGDYVSADTVAQRVGTISYELFCRLTSRVEFIYE